MNVDLQLFPHTCGNPKCNGHNNIIKIKKIVSFNNTKYKDDIKKICKFNKLYTDDEIFIINSLLSDLRDHSKIETVSYKEFTYDTHSNLERNWAKILIDTYDVSEFITNWDIGKRTNYKFFYNVGEKFCSYVPDFYIKTKTGKEYIFEIKSCYTCGLNGEHNKIEDVEKFRIVFLKIISLKEHFNTNNIFIIIDEEMFTYEQFKYRISVILRKS